MVQTKSRQGWQSVATRLSPWFTAMAESHPEAIFDGKTPIGTEGVPDGTLKGDRCTGSYVDVRWNSRVIESLNKCCGSDPDGSPPVGLAICKPMLKHGPTFCHPCRDLQMVEILVPESRQFVVIEPGTCQLHNLSCFNILLIYTMIHQDHLVGRPRNAESICICSIGTICVLFRSQENRSASRLIR
jgi:hypothetical protein